MLRPTPPVALTVAGSDCSSGAGVQADLKTFSAHGVYGLTALTCVVAEVPAHVIDIQALPAKIVCEQMKALLKAFPVAAIKTGMLHTGAVIEAVAEVCASARNIPLVVDPVMMAGSGDVLLKREDVEFYCECLFPYATLVTPNLDEARIFLGARPIDTTAAMEAAGKELSTRHNVAFLIKGGHLAGSEAIDLLCLPNGATHEFCSPRTPGVSTHGTGCTYSAAITAGLAHGLILSTAVARAKQYVTAAIAQSFHWDHHPRGIEALNHWPNSISDNP